MSDKKEKDIRKVGITVELRGEYDDVMGIIGKNEVEYGQLVRILDDLTVILETIETIGGGTRSRIAEELPTTLSIEVDVEGLVPVLRTLEAYGLVELEGNTWNTGPALSQHE